VLDSLLDPFNIILTLLLTGAGSYLAHNYRRQSRLQIAEACRTAYADLWQITELARPTRLREEDGEGVLTTRERKVLYDEITAWYYRNGNGMLLEKNTREVYLAAKHNLTCETHKLKPATVLVQCPQLERAARERHELDRSRISVLVPKGKPCSSVLRGSAFTGAIRVDATCVDAVCTKKRRFLDRAPILDRLPTGLMPERKRAYCVKYPGQCRSLPILALFSASMSEHDRRGCLSIRQLSLLRSQMKSDLAVFGLPWVKGLALHERAFLCEAGLIHGPVTRWLWRFRFWDRDPWADSTNREDPEETCRE